MRLVVAAGLLSWLTALIVVSGPSAEPPRRIVRVGILSAGAAQDARVEELRVGLRDLGYVEGQNLVVTYRWADGRRERLAELAADLVASNAEVIIAMGPTAWAVKQQTSTVPIVFAYSGDPMGTDLVSSLARPGGNVTGLSFMSSDLAAKRLELLKQMLPRIARVAVLYNPGERASTPELRDTESAARTIGVTLLRLEARRAEELEGLFAAARHQRADGVIVFTHGFAIQNRGRIIELSARHRLPTMYGWREFVEAGGLMSYGPDVPAMVRRAASYVDRIVNGAKPGDLPVEQPDRLELIINRKTARALGLSIPASLLLRVDHSID